jgi:hypothetical protein
MRRLGIGLAVLVGLALAGWLGLRGWLTWYGHASQDPAFFEDEITVFEAADGSNRRQRARSCSWAALVRLWSRLAEDMAPLPVLNRASAARSRAWCTSPSAPCCTTPRGVVLYAGDNDLDERSGKSAADVLRDFEAFVGLVHGAVPDARIYYLAIKPSRLRWARWPVQSKANAEIAALCARDPRLAFLDIATPMLATGEPRPRAVPVRRPPPPSAAMRSGRAW